MGLRDPLYLEARSRGFLDRAPAPESVMDSTAVHVSASVDELADADRALFTSIDSKDNIRARLRAANKRVSRLQTSTQLSSNHHENRKRAQRIKKDILVARRLRGGLAPALQHAWGEPVD